MAPFKRLSFFAFLLLGFSTAHTQTLTWDGDPNTVGVFENLTGTWDTATNNRWHNGVTNQGWVSGAIAQFGGTGNASGPLITVNEAISLSGMNILAMGAGTLTAYNFGGTGSINFAPNSTLSIATGSTNGSGNFTTFRLPVSGQNLTILKPEGTALGYMTFGTASPNLTGTLTLKSATGITGGIYASLNATLLTGLTGINVENNSVAQTSSTGTFAIPFTIAGVGGSTVWGAIRTDASNTIYTGGITLAADARLHTHINTTNTTIASVISEVSGSSKNFSRTGTSPFNMTALVSATYSAGNTYTGTTTFGRTIALYSITETTGTEGGLNILDFTAATAPTNNIFYNASAANSLTLLGGLSTTTGLQMKGAAAKNNNQTFSALSLSQGATAIEAISGAGGSATLNLGNITRAALTTLAVKGPVNGSINATYGNLADTFVGPWATYTNGDSSSASWASLVGGSFAGFTGNLDQVTATAISDLPSYSATSHLRISSSSANAVTVSGATDIATVSMTDTTAARSLSIGANTLRLGANGGIQIVKGAMGFTVGSTGDASILTAGGAAGVAGEISLTNLSSTGTLVVNSSIQNNGAGIVSLLLNGTGRTILAGSNSTFTGNILVSSGVLEAASNTALGSATGLTKIMVGASLNLSGGITLAETIQANGHGIASDGVIRNLSGNNTITPAVRIQASSRITSDSGLLTLAGGVIAQSGTTSLYFSGAGDITVNGPLTLGTGILGKDGTGTLTLSGATTATALTTVTNGTLHLNFAGASSPTTNILYNGVTTPGGLTLTNSSNFRITGKSGLTNSQAFGALTFGAGKYRITADTNTATSLTLAFTTVARASGTIVQFDIPTGSFITTTSGTDNTILTGTGGLAYATVGTSDWAATGAAAGGVRQIKGLSTITGGYTPTTATTLSGNADVAAGVLTTTVAADTTITTLRFSQPQATNITQDSTNRILTTGGILVTPEVGANDVRISTAGLRAASNSADLVIIQNNTQGVLRIGSKITNNASGTATSLVKSGLGTVILETSTPYNQGIYNTTYYTGTNRVQEGTLQVISTLNQTGILNLPLYSNADYILGYGTTSGTLKIGGSTGSPVVLYGGLKTDGTGTENRVVGGGATLSGFHHYRPGQTSDFRKAIIGGTGQYENNLTLAINRGILQLGPNNTYAGKTSVHQAELEVEKLANTGQPSSLGTGNFDANAGIIDLASVTGDISGNTAVATLRYIGSTDSSTNRPINLSNNANTTVITAITGSIENMGAGTLKFTSAFTAAGTNTTQRTLRLGGSNTGENEIVSIGNAAQAGALPVKLEKYGIGTWILTGNSTYTGTTTVTDGLLQLGKGGTTGNVGEGDIALSAITSILATNRSGTFNLNNVITGSGSVRINNAPAGTTILTAATSSYTGGTIVNSGTLQIETLSNGTALGTGSVTVNAGAKLAGYGKITPSINNSVILSGGTLSVGDSTTGTEEIGTLIISTSGTGALRFEGASVVSLELLFGAGMGNNTDSAGSATSDLLTIIGNVDFGTNTKLQVLTSQAPEDYLAGDSWKLFDWSGLGTRTGTFAQLELPTLAEGLYWNTNSLYTTGVLVVNVVPEPSRLLLIALAAAASVLRRKRAAC